MDRLGDEEFDVLHSVIHDECIYPSPGKYSDEDTEIISKLYSWVTNEARRRKRWWAR